MDLLAGVALLGLDLVDALVVPLAALLAGVGLAGRAASTGGLTVLSGSARALPGLPLRRGDELRSLRSANGRLTFSVEGECTLIGADYHQL